MNERTKQIRELDGLVRKVLYLKEQGRCYMCGAPASDVAHLIGRAHLCTRFDTHVTGNCHLLCRECHRRDHDGKAEPSYWKVFLNNNGPVALSNLTVRAVEHGRLGPEFLLRHYVRLMGELK